MVPIKFEEHSKDKLQEREIKPSANAWERVSGSLEKPMEKKKTPFFLYGIAASFVGLLLVALVFFMAKDASKIENQNIIVDVKKENKQQEIKKSNTPFIENKAKEAYVVTPKASQEKNIKTKDLIVIPAKQEEDFIVSVESKELMVNKAEKALITPEKVIETKLLQVIAQVNNLEENNGALTDV